MITRVISVDIIGWILLGFHNKSAAIEKICDPYVLHHPSLVILAIWKVFCLGLLCILTAISNSPNKHLRCLSPT